MVVFLYTLYIIFFLLIFCIVSPKIWNHYTPSRMKILNRLFSVLILSLLSVTSAFAQGNNFGLGNEEESNIESLTSRLLNLEERSKFFQVYLNFRGGYHEVLNGTNKGGHLQTAHIRPEFLGDLGKWGYRIRLNLSSDHELNNTDHTNNVIDIARIFYRPNDQWSFSFGKSALNYGTFEFDWNPVHVIEYFEFQSFMPDAAAVSFTAGYEVKNQLFTFEVANAEFLPSYSNNPMASTLYPESSHPLQYSFSWRGGMLDNRLKTICSYTLRDEAKERKTHLWMLGTSYSAKKWEMQVDYNGSFSQLDYLGFATSDALEAGLIDKNHLITDTRYQQLVADFGYRPTPRWNLFAKFGINNSSAKIIKPLHNYRQTYEYTVAAQYFLDKAQDIRLMIGYIGKSTHYKKDLGLDNYQVNRIELSIVSRIKIL